MTIKHAIVIALTLLVIACQQEETETAVPLRPVKTVVIGESQTDSSKIFSGVSQSSQEARLSFKLGGTITRIPVKVGQKVTAGQVIATLDARLYELELERSKASHSEARANLRNTRASYQRSKSLYASNNTSLQELDRARTAFESAQAQLEVANKALELAKLNLSYTQLKVDVDCTVDTLEVEVNENVNAGTEIARVNCSDQLEVQVAVPEGLIQKFAIDMPAQVNFNSIASKNYDAIVSEVGSSLSGSGATFPVTVLISNPDDAIRPGLAAEVSFTLMSDTQTDQPGVYLVPLSAIIDNSESTFVYTLNKMAQTENTATVVKTPISLGELTAGGVQILSGLNTGDIVVIAGISAIREGQMVLH